MPERSSYSPGTPNWVDFMSPDLDASRSFYTQLFGWQAEDQLDDDGNLIYVMFRQDGKNIAGLGPMPPDAPEGMPAVWNTYIATDDVDKTVMKTTEAGGSVMMPAMDVMTAGRMAFLTDTAGAAFGVWQAGDHIGAELVNDDNSLCWNELLTRDVDSAKAFYADVFGWSYDPMPMGDDSPPYNVGKLPGEENGISGIMDMPAMVPEQVPNYWNTYFSVADIDASAAKATELGAKVLFPVMDTPVGRVTTLHDPQMGAFSLIELAPQS